MGCSDVLAAIVVITLVEVVVGVLALVVVIIINFKWNLSTQFATSRKYPELVKSCVTK